MNQPTPLVESLKTIIDGFEPISLEEINRQAALMFRVDTKFVLSIDRLASLLPIWKDTHRVLQVGDTRLANYHNTYWDTPDLALYRAHHAGAGTRIKLRTREYIDSNLRFFEVKLRTNKGKTEKKRRQLNEQTPPADWIQHYSSLDKKHLNGQTLSPVLEVNYQRITLVPKQGSERITIDFALSYRSDEQLYSMGPMVIIEVKTDGSVRSSVLHQLKQEGIREGSISKYCLGIFQLYPKAKKNLFKEQVRSINKKIHFYGPDTDRR